MRDVACGEEISLTEVFCTIWRYRVILVVSLLVSCVLACSALVYVYITTPDRQTASLPFRMLFEGASQGQYPNGLKFDSSDVVDTPVLELVYERNNLQEYLTILDFKTALFVSETNPALTLLDKEYEQKLSNSKLSTVERQALELEFHEKRAGLRNESYQLTFTHSSGFYEIPVSLLYKVLKDVLSTWASLADEQKGAFKYRIPVYTRNILPKGLLDSQDYIVSIDIFDDKISKIFDNLDRVGQLPGSQLVRVGEQNVGLSEVYSNLNDTRQFKLEPLVGLIRNTGLSKNTKLATLYLENQLFQLQLDQREAKEKITVLEDSLNFYLKKSQRAATQPMALGSQRESNAALTATYIPQFGDSFLDRIVEMSTQGNDVQFRQEIASRIVAEGIKVATIDRKAQYYHSLIETMRENSGTGGHPEVISLIKTRFAEIEADILTALDQMNAIYLSISKNNLRPQVELYSVPDPMSIESYRGFSEKKSIMAVFLFVVCAMLLSLSFCFIHFNISRKTDDRK